MLQRRKKKYSHRIHAKRRLAERYGILLNREQYQTLREVIRSHDALTIIKDGPTTIKRVLWEGQNLIAVYNRNTHEIVTFLPPDLTDQQIIDQVELKQMLNPENMIEAEPEAA